MAIEQVEVILADLAGVVRVSGTTILQAGRVVADSVDATQKAAGQYTDKLCASLDTFRDSMDRNSRATTRLALALVVITAIYAAATVAQVAGWGSTGMPITRSVAPPSPPPARP